PTQDELEQGGPVLRRLIGVYEGFARRALRHPALSAACMAGVLAGGIWLYTRLETDFLPKQDEGAFVLDYYTRPGTSLAETDRMLRHVETILRETPEVESYSRRTGARLALAIAEPNTGDFLVKLRPDRDRSTEEVIDGLRNRIHAAEPALHTEFPGVLSDLIGDLTWSPDPVEIKIFTNDPPTLKRLAARVARTIQTIPGVVDVNDGLVVAGPTLSFRVRPPAASRVGLDTVSIGTALRTALLGADTSYLLEGDRTVGVRVLLAETAKTRASNIDDLPLFAPGGPRVTVGEVTRIRRVPGLLERHREDLRELVAVSARFSGVDLGHGMSAIRRNIAETIERPPGVSIEYGGLYQQQRESFYNLTLVLVMAVVFVFGVLLLEFRSLWPPLAIVFGAVLALFGVIAALWLTDTSLNIVSFLGAIIGVGIVAKNGILMLDFVDHLRRRGLPLREALVQSGRRRLRPVLMTSLTTFLGLLPLAYGIGAGADMLRPLAVAVIGALCVSLLLSLVATPVTYFILLTLFRRTAAGPESVPAPSAAGASS
ncbi:MAG: efflux RND transporter permease subunit, partial [Planctomycetota bacterium]